MESILQVGYEKKLKWSGAIMTHVLIKFGYERQRQRTYYIHLTRFTCSYTLLHVLYCRIASTMNPTLTIEIEQ